MSNRMGLLGPTPMVDRGSGSYDTSKEGNDNRHEGRSQRRPGSGSYDMALWEHQMGKAPTTMGGIEKHIKQ